MSNRFRYLINEDIQDSIRSAGDELANIIVSKVNIPVDSSRYVRIFIQWRTGKKVIDPKTSQQPKPSRLKRFSQLSKGGINNVLKSFGFNIELT